MTAAEALARSGDRAAAPVGLVAVVGAGATNLKSTVALNLAVALADLHPGSEVALADLHGAVMRALRVAAPGATVFPRPGRPLRVGSRPDAADDRLGVVDPPARFDDVTRGVVCRADLVVVPVDGSALALRVLHEVVELVGPSGGDRVRAVLARRLPRTVDRWSLVERIDEHVPGSLFVATIPMARRDSERDGAAVLYAPGTAAARAYAALAVEVADRLRVRSSQAGALSTSA